MAAVINAPIGTAYAARAVVAAKKLGVNMNDTKDEVALIKKEGPKYQSGKGCLADGIIGEWMGWTSGLEPIVSPQKVKSHLMSVYRHNFRTDLTGHANPHAVAAVLTKSRSPSAA